MRWNPFRRRTADDSASRAVDWDGIVIVNEEGFEVIDLARIAPLPDHALIRDLAASAVSGTQTIEAKRWAFGSAQVAARHAYLQGWYAGLEAAGAEPRLAKIARTPSDHRVGRAPVRGEG